MRFLKTQTTSYMDAIYVWSALDPDYLPRPTKSKSQDIFVLCITLRYVCMYSFEGQGTRESPNPLADGNLKPRKQTRVGRVTASNTQATAPSPTPLGVVEVSTHVPSHSGRF
jgi:hypothetical protein